MIHIPQISKLNNLSINVYVINKVSKNNEIITFYLSKNKSDEPTYHLLIIKSTEIELQNLSLIIIISVEICTLFCFNKCILK